MPRGYLSPKRELEYQNLVLLRRSRDISAAVYEKKKSAVYAQQQRAEARAAALARAREAAKAPRVARASKTPKAKKGRTVGSVSFTNDFPIDSRPDVYRAFKTNYKGPVVISGSMRGKKGVTPFSLQYDFTNTSLSKAYKTFRHDLQIVGELDSGDMIQFALDTSISFNEVKTVKSRGAVKQSFREGAANCFIAPIHSYLLQKRDEYVSEKSKKNIAPKIRKAEEYLTTYAGGVPEDECEDVCKSLGVSVTLYDVLGGRITTYNKTALWAISYHNTRVDHVEEGKLTVKNDFIPVSQKEMDEHVKILRKEGKHFLVEGMAKRVGITKLHTLNGSYQVVSDTTEAYDEQRDANKIFDYAVDAVRYPELAAFLQESYIVHSAPVVVNDGETVDMLDMKKAYAQFAACKYWDSCKFLGKVSRFVSFPDSVGREFLEAHTGVYRIKVLKTTRMLEVLGISAGCCYTLPSPEILYYLDAGVELVVTQGAWGTTFDFTFVNEMLDSRNLYRVYSGMLGMDYPSKVYSFPGTENDSFLVAHQLGQDCKRVNGLIQVYVPKPVHNVTFHIAAFITSYTRIQMMMKMEEIGFDNITHVLLDAIYTSKAVEEDAIFRKKEASGFDGDFASKWYEERDEYKFSVFPVYDGVSGNTAFLGAGGTGKTYSVLKENSGYGRTLYVSPTRMLGLKMAADTGCAWTTIHKLIGLDVDGKKVRTYAEENGRLPSVVLVDEITMMSDEMVRAGIKECAGSLLILAGDMEGAQAFQTRNGDGSSFTKLYDVTGWPTKYFTTDYRAAGCVKLQEFKLKLRDVMRRVYVNGEKKDAEAIEAFIMDNVEIIGFWDAVEDFKAGDKWIASTHAISNSLLQAGVLSGYRVKSPGRCNDGVFRSKGEVVEKDVGDKCEARGSITIHSCQGLTFDCRKIFISVVGGFEYSMLYTAISRARRWEQLVFVGL